MIRIDEIRGFTGPSVFAAWPCVSGLLRVAPQAVAQAELRRLARALEALLPAPEAAAPSGGPPTDLAALVARMTIALQNAVGPPVSRFSIAQETSGWRLAIAYAAPRTGIAALEAAVRWAGSALSEDDDSAQRALEAFKASVRLFAPSVEQQCLIEEAVRRGIPWNIRAGVHWLGWGSARRAIAGIMTDATSKMAAALATSKPAAAAVMGAAGIPVPRHMQAKDPEAAVRFAERLGYPVVMKPANTDMGTAVHLEIGDAAEVRRIFPRVARHGPVLVERQQPGFDHRLLIVAGKLVAAAVRRPPQVTGDGSHTVRQLIEATNTDPRRGIAHSNILEKIPVDDETVRVLAHQGLTLDDVPARGRALRLRFTANLSTGGNSVDVTASVHPDNRVLAERAARIVGLDLAGVDMITPDIGRSHLEVGGVIGEINPNPGFRPHLSAPGSPDVAAAVIDALFPPPGNGRIPAAVVTGTNGKTTTCRMVAAILEAAGHTVGLATTDGVQVGRDPIAAGDEAGPRGARMVLNDPAVTAAVLEAARGGILRHGIGPDRYAVAAVLNVGTDHVGSDGITSVDDLARLKSTVLAGAEAAVVLNADDAHCLAMTQQASGRRVILVGTDPGSSALVGHLADGGDAVVTLGAGADRRLAVLSGPRETFSMPLHAIPAGFDGRAEFNVRNAMFATAIAIGLDLPREAIARGLAAFLPDERWSRGRANLLTVGNIRVLIDYAHNAEALTAIGAFVSKLPIRGRRLLLLDAPGNRSDASYDAVAAAAAATGYAHYVCSCGLPRGRAVGETSRLLAEGLARHGVAPQCIDALEPFERALERLFLTARPGDLLVLPCDSPQEVLNHPLFKARLETGS